VFGQVGVHPALQVGVLPAGPALDDVRDLADRAAHMVGDQAHQARVVVLREHPRGGLHELPHRAGQPPRVGRVDLGFGHPPEDGTTVQSILMAPSNLASPDAELPVQYTVTT
jgi:hypothetical protein